MSHTEKLLSWIKKLSHKKIIFKHTYFKIALLTHAMNQTKMELRTIQRLRKNR